MPRWVTILPLLGAISISGCGRASDAAICDGTERLRDAHTEALLADGGPRSVTTGANLLRAMDAGCR